MEGVGVCPCKAVAGWMGLDFCCLYSRPLRTGVSLASPQHPLFTALGLWKHRDQGKAQLRPLGPTVQLERHACLQMAMTRRGRGWDRASAQSWGSLGAASHPFWEFARKPFRMSKTWRRVAGGGEGERQWTKAWR